MIEGSHARARHRQSGESALTVVVYNVLSFVQTARIVEVERTLNYHVGFFIGRRLRRFEGDHIGCSNGVLAVVWCMLVGQEDLFTNKCAGVGIGLKGRLRAKLVVLIRMAPDECAGRGLLVRCRNGQGECIRVRSRS